MILADEPAAVELNEGIIRITGRHFPSVVPPTETKAKPFGDVKFAE